MSKPAAKSRAHDHRPSRAEARHHTRSRRPLWIGAGIVVVVALALGVALATGGGTKASAGRSPASAALVAKVTSVPSSVLDQVGQGTAATPPAINAPALTKDGKPLVVYMGAEYCPYCAAERWAVVMAMSRFGTFSGLQLTQSSSVDAFPNTETFSFHGSAYTSTYLAFEAVETQTNKLAGSGGYAKLDTPTAEQDKLMATYDTPPYVKGQAGGIPFVDLGGKFAFSGATYDVAVLQGKTADQIATALHDPAGPIAQGVVGAANGITAALCALTQSKPASACSVSAVHKLQSNLG